MKKVLAALLLGYAGMVNAQTDHIVISQVYGAGGNVGAPFSHDYVELFNPTESAVVLDGWSLQYSSPASSTWNSNKVDLRGTIQPGKYFLIGLNGGSGSNGNPLPTPDFFSTAITITATGGKVVLVKSTTLLSGNCPVRADIVDFVGFGTTADCFELKAGPATSVSAAIFRASNGCTDTDNNNADFTTGVPSPRNSAATGSNCNGSSIAVTSLSAPLFCVGATTATGTVNFTGTGTFSNTTVTAVLSDANGSFAAPVAIGNTIVSGTNPSGSITFTIPANTSSGVRYRIRVESANPPIPGQPGDAFEIINGAKDVSFFLSAASTGQTTLRWVNPPGCFDEFMIVAKESPFSATIPTGNGGVYVANSDYAGNASNLDGGKVVYKGSTNRPVISGLTDGTKYYFKVFTRNGTAWSNGIEITDVPRVVPGPGDIIINQLNPGYDTKIEEYIELVNTTGKTFNLSDVVLKFANQSGNNVVAGGTLSGLLQPHSYLLIAHLHMDAVTVGKTSGLVPDLKLDLGFGDINQQVALMRKTDSSLIDAVAFGTISSPVYVEGTPTANPTSQSGLKRVFDGSDNNNNATDFVTVAKAAIDLRNSNSRLANEQAVLPAGTYTVVTVTGNATLAGNINTQSLHFSNGLLTLGNNNITVSNISGTSDLRYIRTNGTGSVIIPAITQVPVLFPVGNTTYNPVTITNGSGLNWQVAIQDSIGSEPSPFYKSKTVNRTWAIAPEGLPVVGASLSFEFNPTELTQVNTGFVKDEAVQIWNYHSNRWMQAGDTQLPASGANGYKRVTISNQTHFSPFVIANTLSTLPINFKDVRATQQGSAIQVSFTNNTETEVKRYNIERSANGQDFVPVHSIEPQKNDGSSVAYNWTDVQPHPAYSYYRIKGEETTGRFIYSSIVRSNSASTIKMFTVYPNPVQGRQLSWEATLQKGQYTVSLLVPNGQAIILQQLAHPGGNVSGTIQLPPAVKPGMGILEIRSKDKVLQKSILVL